MDTRNKRTRRAANSTGTKCCTTKYNGIDSSTAEAIFALAVLFVFLSLPIAMGMAFMGGAF